MLLAILIDTQPKESSGSGGRSREDEVKDKLQSELIKMLPQDFIEVDVDEKLKSLKGPKNLLDTGKNIPLNVFLFQEI